MQLLLGLAETFHCKIIEINYNCVATVQYFRDSSSLVCVKRHVLKSIYLVCPPMSSTKSVLVNSESVDAFVDSQKQYSKWCQYHITIEQRSIALRHVLPITLSIAPYLNGLRLEHVIHTF
ncbi:hypothetical protein INT45_012671 [Circinella minor]|uniref:Uncharacterized protein n=1 Tax=Circinella minor TaxID=1195481 RepID=A0A8H7VI63_9FUNG|nr:hypothetical protein INT45_012671 [Circinella minor]